MNETISDIMYPLLKKKLVDPFTIGMKLFIEWVDTIGGLFVKDTSMYASENMTLVASAIEEIA